LDFAKSFFMTHKAFFIALIYGAVMFAGGAGVAGTVQALLYKDMSRKVYMYIGTIAGFLAYSIFIGYFPDFSKNNDDPKRDMVQKQPRFIEILFEYIMLPLALALTAVLLIWSVKTIITGEQVPFMRLSSIAAGFATGAGLLSGAVSVAGAAGFAGTFTPSISGSYVFSSGFRGPDFNASGRRLPFFLPSLILVFPRMNVNKCLADIKKCGRIKPAVPAP
jgi:hypothetical protein